MDSRYAGALKAFISHHPSEAPIDPGAPDPLRDRPADRSPLVSRRPPPTAAPGGAPTGAALLPLIYAQLPLAPTYRWRRPHPEPMRGHRMNGR